MTAADTLTRVDAELAGIARALRRNLDPGWQQVYRKRVDTLLDRRLDLTR